MLIIIKYDIYINKNIINGIKGIVVNIIINLKNI